MKRNVEVPKQIREAFQGKLTECVNIARQRSGKDIPMFPLIFSQMGHRAGICATSLIVGSTIKINPDFFKNPKDYDEQLNDTLPHEVAHAVVDFLYPPILATDGVSQLASIISRRRLIQRQVPPHGNEWVRVMNWFGIRNPNTHHKMNMAGVAVRKKVARPFNYLCGCGMPHPLSLRLHRDIQENGRKRACKGCRQVIVYERQRGKPVKAPAINLNVERTFPSTKPLPPATHKTVTRFVNGALVNERVSI